jgi:hypothetical protein
MGIKKDAFFRHFVRTRVAFEKQWREMFFNEIEPVWEKARGNVDQAVNIVLSEPTTYPHLNNFPFTKDRLENAMDIAAQLSHAIPQQAPVDILEDARKGRAPLPRMAEAVGRSHYMIIRPEKFFQVLRANEQTMHDILQPVDTQTISHVLESGDSPEQKLEKIHQALKIAWIREYFANYNSIKARVQALAPRPIKDASKVYKVIFAYLDSLE